jgi:phage-related protein
VAGLKWDVEFYERSSGRCPTREFLDALSSRELVFVERAFERLETYGPGLRRPHVDYLRDDIWELRVRTPDSQLRFLYFFFDGRKIVVTHGIKKKTPEVPPKEIDKAIQYRLDYLERQ